MSKHLYTSYPPYILWLLLLSRKTFQTWTCSPAQVLIRYLLLSSSTQRKQFRMIVVRDTQKTFHFPFLLTCSICSCKTVSPHIVGTESKLRLYTKKVQLRPPKITVCWLSMVVSIDFLQMWSGTCWRTGLLLNIKYQTLNWFLPHKEHQPTPLYSLALFERYHSNHVYRMPIPSQWWWQNFWGGCA